MAKKPTYEELEQRVKGLKKETVKRKQTEEALRESEEKFRNFLENLGDIAYETDSSGNVTYGNKMSEIITGVPLKDIVGKPFLPHFEKESQEIAIDAYQRTLNGESPEFELTLTSGRICHFKNEPLREKNGRIIGVFGIARDVTSTKLAENALRESEEKWRSLVENAPGFIINMNRDGKIQFINRGVPGISAKEAIGQSVYKYIEPEYRNTARETIKQVFETGEPSSYIVKGIGPDGHHISWYETQVGPIRHDSRVVAATLITTDISDRKQAEEALRQSEDKYKTLTESSLTGIYIHQDGEYVFVNDRFAQIHGYRPEELLGEHYLTLIHPDETERVRQTGSKRLNGEPTPQRYEVKRLRKDGEAVWCATIAVRIEYRGKPAIMGNIVDINEHKRAEESLRVSEERFRTFAEAAPYGLSIMRPDKTFEYLNPRFTGIFGYTSEDIPDKYIWFEKAYPDKEYRDMVISVWNQYFAEDFDGGQIDPNIFKVRCKDGQDKIIHFRNVISSDGRHFLTYQDITAQAKAEQALRERETELKIKTNSLEEMNTALRVLLERRDEDKTELEEKVLVNVKELVVPFLEKVKKTSLDPRQVAYIDILESNLNDIISPFLHKLSSKYSNLTPKEIQVAGLVKEGKTTKEIAELMISTTDAIEFHRKSLRKKLGLKNTKSNLRSYLLFLP